MNYRNLYNKIIANRQKNPITEGYLENHHIIPRSLGGSDDKDNIVGLTAREHFICHYLLAKMYPKESLEWYKMNHAFMQMKAESYTQSRYYNSRLYEALRGNFSSVMSWSQTGSRNSQYGTRWIHSVDLKKSRRIDKNESIPDGWKIGRIIDFSLEEKKILKKQNDLIRKENRKKKQKAIKKAKEKERAFVLYDQFKKSKLSLNAFAKQTDFSNAHLSIIFRKYIEEYASLSKEKITSVKSLRPSK